MSYIVENIKVENGKVTTLVAERQVGMTTYLCNLIKQFGYKNADYRILIVSHHMNSAEQTFKTFQEINEYNKNVDYCSINNIQRKIIGKNYDLVIFDCPNIHDTENNNIIFDFKTIMPNCKIVIGITWENIPFNEKDNKIIRKNFIIKSDYAYYFTLTYGGKLLIHDILEDVVESYHKEKEKIKRIIQFLEE